MYTLMIWLYAVDQYARYVDGKLITCAGPVREENL